MQRHAFTLAATAHLRQAPWAKQTLRQPLRGEIERRNGQLDSVPGHPFKINEIGLDGFPLTEWRTALSPIQAGATKLLSDEPRQWVPVFCERLRRSETIQWSLVEEILETLKQCAYGENAQLNQLAASIADLKYLHLNSITDPMELTGDGDQRISYGTDRLRAGAGACELICSQAELFELGCILLSHVKRSQGMDQTDL